MWLPEPKAPSSHPYPQSAFTLIELLITIGILAVLATVTVLVVNPIQFFAQARDSRRVSDLQTINTAMKFVALQGISEGSANTVYVSIPDSSATCANLGLPSLPAGWVYACATSANYRKVDGTGWIPVAFTSLSAGTPLSTLPVDPVNTTSSSYYYTYITGGSWQLNARIESEKYAEVAGGDGGSDPTVLEKGTDLELASFTHGMVGYWKFDEGSGTTAMDSSGRGLTGTWNGTSPNHYVAGRVGPYAATFNGTNDYVAISDPPFSWQASYSFWNKPSGTGSRTVISHLRMIVRSTTAALSFDNLGTTSNSYTRSNAGIWEHVVIVNDSLSTFKTKYYVNGDLVQTSDSTAGNATNGSQIGGYAGTNLFSGDIDDLRVYNRLLSDAEVEAIYNASL